MTLNVPVTPAIIFTASAATASKSSRGISTAGQTLCTPNTFVTLRMQASMSSNSLTKMRPSCSQTWPWMSFTA